MSRYLDPGWQVAIAISGELYDINGFDQPGVETGKVHAHTLLSRLGYKKQRAGIDALRARGKARYEI